MIPRTPLANTVHGRVSTLFAGSGTLNLYVDIGNSRLKWGWHATHTGWQSAGSPYTSPLTHSFLDGIWSGQPVPRSVMVSNVAGIGARRVLDRWVRDSWRIDAHFACYEESMGHTINGYVNKAQFGIDRWLALLAAREKYEGDLCVIDCGTAVTGDWLSADNQHSGGVIVPGRALLMRAVGQIPAIRHSAANDPIIDWPWETMMTRDTESALRNGINCAVIGAMNRIISQASETYETALRVVLTGGDVPPLTQLPDVPVSLEPDLVLHGLVCYARRKRLS